MFRLDSNTELYNYLLCLARLLEGTPAAPLAVPLHNAAAQATALNTEFLGESLIALRTVLQNERGVLNGTEREKLESAISQVAFVLKK